ncbi:MAG: hypothetical protein P1V51_18820 [Deltaproteobacteria bacterium]|nr:hypothetical protein [Deltaproteobacteria bacterium]
MQTRSRDLLLAPLLLILLLGPGCPGPDEPGGDGGGGSDAGLDGGGPDGGEPDGGADAGCEDPACVPCAQGGAYCPAGEICLDERCQESCEAGTQRCQGPRLEVCNASGTYDPIASCGLGGLCQGDACVAVTDCAGDSPPCCSQPSECEGLAELYTCSECRPTVRTIACASGACLQLPTGLDFTLLGDASGLPDPTRVASGVITIYRGETADGRVADCATLLDQSLGSSPHDAEDPQLNPTISRPYEFTGGTGSDLFTALVLGSPGGGDQTIVFSVYDDTRGRGLRLGRGCVDHAEPLMGETLTLSLLP